MNHWNVVTSGVECTLSSSSQTELPQFNKPPKPKEFIFFKNKDQFANLEFLALLACEQMKCSHYPRCNFWVLHLWIFGQKLACEFPLGHVPGVMISISAILELIKTKQYLHTGSFKKAQDIFFSWTPASIKCQTKEYVSTKSLPKQDVSVTAGQLQQASHRMLTSHACLTPPYWKLIVFFWLLAASYTTKRETTADS